MADKYFRTKSVSAQACVQFLRKQVKMSRFQLSMHGHHVK